MGITNLIRAAVLKTNPYWPFSSLNKVPYYAAINSFVRLCRSFPEIRSVYLRHSLAKKDWVPGLSDIDWTIAIDDRLSDSQELRFLDSFWKSYGKARRYFPMLGEAEILSEEEISNIGFFRIKNRESRHWKLMLGIDRRLPAMIEGNASRDLAYNALMLYNFYFLPFFFSKNIPEDILEKRLSRLLEKISAAAGRDETGKTIYDSLYSAVKQLDSLAVALPAPRPDGPGGIEISISGEKPKKQGPNSYLENIALFVNELKGICGHNAESVIFNDRTACFFIIIKDGLGREGFKDFLRDIRGIFLKHGMPHPFLLTKKILENSIIAYEPTWFYQLFYRGEVLCGKDIIKDLKRPDKAILLEHSAQKSLLSLMHLRSFSPEPGAAAYLDWISENSSDVFFSRLINEKLTLEKGIIVVSHTGLLEEWQKQYPDSYHSRKTQPAESRFKLLRDCAGSLTKSALRYLKGIG